MAELEQADWRLAPRPVLDPSLDIVMVWRLTWFAASYRSIALAIQLGSEALESRQRAPAGQLGTES